MDGIDAVGDAVTGGLLARAVEPQAGESDRTATRTRRTASIAERRLTGPYCSACGQKAHVHRSVRGFLQDFVAGPVQFRGQDLADAADARLVPGRHDPALHRRRARAVHLARRALSVHRLRDVRGAQPHRRSLARLQRQDVKDGLKTEIADQQKQARRAGAEAKANRRCRQERRRDLDRKIAKRKEDIAESAEDAERRRRWLQRSSATRRRAGSGHSSRMRRKTPTLCR